MEKFHYRMKDKSFGAAIFICYDGQRVKLRMLE